VQQDKRRTAPDDAVVKAVRRAMFRKRTRGLIYGGGPSSEWLHTTSATKTTASHPSASVTHPFSHFHPAMKQVGPTGNLTVI
jgi:hypothetical protein